MSTSPVRVALVGRRLEHNENLGLAYLAAALEQAGFRAERHYVNDALELERALTSISLDPPAVVGLSLADGGSALLPLALGEALAQAGYRGHVTAGGQFATLARDWLLERQPWLDSVVRFAGERPLVEIVQRVLAGESVHGVAGVTTRQGDGAPARVTDSAPLALRPLRDELPEILGHKAAHIAASRGCLGRCQYCGPAALHTLERREGVRAGFASEALTAAGVGGVRRRELEAVCDEMAELWHERKVRYFYFVDEHLLPYAEPEALEYLRLWKAGLAAREVGPLGIGTMLRADRVTPAIARAFAELGLVRVFVGLELATAEEGRRFGRQPPAERELGLLGELARAGVVTVSNLMLVNPYSTPETIARGIDLLEQVPRGVFEATRMMVYHGTRLHQTLQEEGRLVGNPFRYGYTFDDPRVERFAEIFMRLRAEAFWDYSVAFRTHDAFLALCLSRRLQPERVDAALAARLERARARVNQLYVAAYRQALDLALSGGGFASAAPLVRAIRPRVREIEAELDAVEARLGELGARRAAPFAPMRAAAASVVSFVLATACARDKAPEAAPSGLLSDAGDEAAAPPPEVVDAAVPSEELAYPDAADAGGPAANVCSAAEREALLADATRVVLGVDACFSGRIALGGPPTATHTLGAWTRAARLCQVSLRSDPHAVEQALSGRAARCTESDGRPIGAEVKGKGHDDVGGAASAVAKCRVMGMSPAVRVVLDAKGRVLRVDGGLPTQAKCIRQVLAGLSFPCLASFEVCAEHVIIE